MCGIAGIVAKQVAQDAQQQVRKATAVLAHRGPEEENFWTNNDQTVFFGHRRLCILDLSKAASQPMGYAGRYTLVYNGEIYNYRELRKELEAEGCSFHSQSDTEVVLVAYAAWGSSCLQRFDGAFAFAIWDEKEQILFAARDRFGEKPFFFFYDNEQFVFASEPKALWAMGVEKEVNKSLLYNFLTLGYTSNPSDATETFYNNINKLPAAHSLTCSLQKNALHTHCYWQVYVDVNKTVSEEDATEQFKQLFADSIRKRLRSDVAIGTSLSGGLDSSSIVAFCANETAEQYTHKCFTASFSGFEKDETNYASLVAKQFGLQHFTTTITADEVPLLMDMVASQQDEPFSSASVLAQYKVFKAAKQHGVTVLLDGQGADEILGGYRKYYKWWWQELYRTNRKLYAQEWKAARELNVDENFGIKNKLAALLPDFAASLLYTQKSKNAFRNPDLNRDFAFSNKQNFYYTTPPHPNLNGALHYNTFVNGLEELLRFADRNSMAHSVEVRLPFLQHQLVEFLFTLPPQFKIHRGWTKWLLRKAVENKLPQEIVWRKDKVGYEPPQKAWMQNAAVQERIMQARKKLVNEGVLNETVLIKNISAKDAHEEESFDWRYWSAAQLF
ncbi:asparagine synthase (glutamine-hydrolyzing) [Flavisolibacter ginsenosidimutans]|uniref:asparagine synthase (glutamine-hydrolyzing) n=1 Tax=Flavisolibacter ginsenosidimutans TaxID=661481 RepID=A0A5B8ULP3_9BACT|nr:asparagine synthase (glutamine-hydrolyzing) [Flavisolibacter ginsenosidimutans]QEC57089.1 asparagine synthase (glutamine-hydrolyzing) [Flavisolibacter ginsenosidimutans]